MTFRIHPPDDGVDESDPVSMLWVRNAVILLALAVSLLLVGRMAYTFVMFVAEA